MYIFVIIIFIVIIIILTIIFYFNYFIIVIIIIIYLLYVFNILFFIFFSFYLFYFHFLKCLFYFILFTSKKSFLKKNERIFFIRKEKFVRNYMTVMHGLISNATFDASSSTYRYRAHSFLPPITRLITTLKFPMET